MYQTTYTWLGGFILGAALGYGGANALNYYHQRHANENMHIQSMRNDKEGIVLNREGKNFIFVIQPDGSFKRIQDEKGLELKLNK